MGGDNRNPERNEPSQSGKRLPYKNFRFHPTEGYSLQGDDQRPTVPSIPTPSTAETLPSTPIAKPLPLPYDDEEDISQRPTEKSPAMPKSPLTSAPQTPKFNQSGNTPK